MALQALVPPLAALPEAGQRAALAEPLLPLDVEGDRQYFLRWWWGRMRLCACGTTRFRAGSAHGEWAGPLPAAGREQQRPC